VARAYQQRMFRAARAGLALCGLGARQVEARCAYWIQKHPVTQEPAFIMTHYADGAHIGSHQLLPAVW
jgi:hypothetical protein